MPKSCRSRDYAASKLRPKSARREEIDAIKKHVGTAAGDEESAAYMLEKWQHSHGSRLQFAASLKTLIEAGFLSFAEVLREDMHGLWTD